VSGATTTRAGFSVHRRKPVGLPDDNGAPSTSAAGVPDAPAAPRRHSLLWRLSVIDISVLLAIVLLLALTPVTISAPVQPVEAAILLAGFVVIGTANLLLLRRAVSPLNELSEVMRSIDPMEPGTRVKVDDMPDTELVVLGESFNAMLDRLELERRQSALRALSAQEAERLRIARELHDEIGQTLTAIAIEAERNADVATGDRESWARAARLAQHSVEDLRRIARRLRPEALDDLGLINAFIALCNRISEAGGIEVARRLPDSVPPHRPEVDLVLYRVAQEALTNVIRHAGASRAEVTLAVDGDRMHLEVRDDGAGMRLPAPASSNGIIGMRERALLVGGTLDIESEPGRGTTVRLEVPIGVT
jgi:two-component system, NarL family, sensor histidine kinase UhpB